jgi:pimeloyl-ACP methyl ester carboxylesterase
VVNGSPDLHVHSWGSGDRLALLLHGQFGDGLMWWEVGPAIADLGYRVLAPDLPGHGRSPADPRATLASTVSAVARACPAPEVAIGQSLGGLVLANAASGLGVARAIYVDSPSRLERRAGRDEMRRRLAATKAERTIGWLRATRQDWTERDRRIEAAAAKRFDVETSLSLLESMVGRDHRPAKSIRSLMIAPDPSAYLSADDCHALVDAGVEVRRIPGAGHTVWYGHVPEFLAALDGWL